MLIKYNNDRLGQLLRNNSFQLLLKNPKQYQSGQPSQKRYFDPLESTRRRHYGCDQTFTSKRIKSPEIKREGIEKIKVIENQLQPLPLHRSH